MARAKTQPAESCHFITGSDEAAVKTAARELAERLAPGADAFGLEVIDGAVEGVEAAEARLAEAINAVRTLPFLGGKKLIWLKSASFLEDSVTGRSETILTGLEHLCDALEEGLPEGVQFLLSAPRADRRRTSYKRLVKLCQTGTFDLPDLGFRGGEENLIAWVAEKVRERGLQLAPEAVEALAARVGLNTLQMASELAKLETAFGRTVIIGVSDIRALVPQTREGGIFDLSGAILQRDPALALDTLAQLFRQGEKGVGILLAAIVPTVRNLLLMKDLMQRHRLGPCQYAGQLTTALQCLPAQETAHLPRKKDGSLNAYPLSLASAHISNFTLAELSAGFRDCAATAQELFGGGLEEDVLLARLLLGLLARGGGGA